MKIRPIWVGVLCAVTGVLLERFSKARDLRRMPQRPDVARWEEEGGATARVPNAAPYAREPGF